MAHGIMGQTNGPSLAWVQKVSFRPILDPFGPKKQANQTDDFSWKNGLGQFYTLICCYFHAQAAKTYTATNINENKKTDRRH